MSGAYLIFTSNHILKTPAYHLIWNLLLRILSVDFLSMQKGIFGNDLTWSNDLAHIFLIQRHFKWCFPTLKVTSQGGPRKLGPVWPLFWIPYNRLFSSNWVPCVQPGVTCDDGGCPAWRHCVAQNSLFLFSADRALMFHIDLHPFPSFTTAFIQTSLDRRQTKIVFSLNEAGQPQK